MGWTPLPLSRPSEGLSRRPACARGRFTAARVRKRRDEVASRKNQNPIDREKGRQTGHAKDHDERRHPQLSKSKSQHVISLSKPRGRGVSVSAYGYITSLIIWADFWTGLTSLRRQHSAAGLRLCQLWANPLMTSLMTTSPGIDGLFEPRADPPGSTTYHRADANFSAATRCHCFSATR